MMHNHLNEAISPATVDLIATTIKGHTQNGSGMSIWYSANFLHSHLALLPCLGWISGKKQKWTFPEKRLFLWLCHSHHFYLIGGKSIQSQVFTIFLKFNSIVYKFPSCHIGGKNNGPYWRNFDGKLCNLGFYFHGFKPIIGNFDGEGLIENKVKCFLENI